MTKTERSEIERSLAKLKTERAKGECEGCPFNDICAMTVTETETMLAMEDLQTASQADPA